MPDPTPHTFYTDLAVVEDWLTERTVAEVAS